MIDLPRRRLIVFNDAENGVYHRREEFTEEENIKPEFAPNASVSLAELLPPTE